MGSVPIANDDKAPIGAPVLYFLWFTRWYTDPLALGPLAVSSLKTSSEVWSPTDEQSDITQDIMYGSVAEQYNNKQSTVEPHVYPLFAAPPTPLRMESPYTLDLLQLGTDLYGTLYRIRDRPAIPTLDHHPMGQSLLLEGSRGSYFMRGSLQMWYPYLWYTDGNRLGTIVPIVYHPLPMGGVNKLRYFVLYSMIGYLI
ncbi:hypothetical protein G9A89_000336 [Geosiphon pyriformis]|nr:hypothetical protein G9A89_000336 [Geosiphon pyriformis]